jgi:hypothetical protein
MTSVALNAWRSTRAGRLDRLQSVHTAIGGAGPGRRWVTEELNHALVLRLAAEFQGFARDLHAEASRAIATSLAADSRQREDALTWLLLSTRRLSRGNANPDVLAHDFGLLGMKLWPKLQQCYPVRAGQWRQRLHKLNEARNGLAHDDGQKIDGVAGAGWPLTLRSIKRWRSTLDGLTAGMDRVVAEHVHQVFGVRAW